MKALIVFLTLMTTTFANENATRLEEGDTFLTTISETRNVSQRLMCPDYDCIVNGTIITVELPLGGCLDRLGPVTYTVEQRGNQLAVEMTAIRIVNKKSLAAFCVKEPTEFVEITLPNMYGFASVELLEAAPRAN